MVPKGLHLIQTAIGSTEQGLHGLGTVGIDSHTEAHRDRWRLRVTHQTVRNTTTQPLGCSFISLGKYDHEFVSSKACRSVYGATRKPQHLYYPAQRSIADQVSVPVIDTFEIVEIEKQQGKGSRSPLRALDLGLEPINQLTIVGNPCQRDGGRDVRAPRDLDRICDMYCKERKVSKNSYS